MINTIQNLAVSTQNTQGYLSRQGSEFKIYSPHHEVKNFKVVGQNVEGITYAWQNSHTQVEQVDGYLIKIVQRADVNHTQ